jgi:hypothetical protein
MVLESNQNPPKKLKVSSCKDDRKVILELPTFYSFSPERRPQSDCQSAKTHTEIRTKFGMAPQH